MCFLAKFIAIFLAGVLCHISATAQQPVLRATTLSPRVLRANSSRVCAADPLRATARDDIRSDVRRILSNLSTQTTTPPPGSLMLPQCCNDPTGWTQIAFINMTDTSYQCPSNFREITTPRRVCGRRSTTIGSCDGVTFSVNGARYNQVCGRIIAYQIGTPAAFHEHFSQGTGIESFYLEGISITHGSPRQHVWSFAATPGESYSTSSGDPSLCPCSNSAVTYSTPTFVGNDYFCETGTTMPCCPKGMFFADDPLFDGQGCGASSSCCTYNTPPWFCRSLPQSTTDDLEVRICSDMGTSQDDVPFEILEMYIK